MFPRISFLFGALIAGFAAHDVRAQGNDAFADRVPLGGASVTAVSTITPQTPEAGEPAHGGDDFNGSLWWSWTAPTTGVVNFSSFGSAAQASSFSRPQVAVYTGSSLANLVEAGSTNGLGDDYPYSVSGALEAGVSTNVPVVAGTVYQIALTTRSYAPSPTVLSINRPPTIVSSATAAGTIGNSFKYALAASNLPSLFGASSLPLGLVCNPATGEISGTPLEAGTFSVALQAANAAGAGAATLTLRIGASVAASAAPGFYGAAAVSGAVGVPFSYTVFAVGGSPLRYEVTGLPAGLAFDAADATLRGVPEAAGVFQVNIAATNGTGTSTEIVTLIIDESAQLPLITSLAADTGNVGAPFYYYLSSSDSAASFMAANLPPGLVFDGSSISGTPATAGVFAVPLSATNSAGTSTAALTIAIDPALSASPILQITSSPTATGIAGASFSYAIAADNANAFTASGLPPGLSLNPQSGFITGVPNAAGVFPALLTAGDGAATVSAVVKFTITATPAASPAQPLVFTSSAGALGYVGSYFSYSARVADSFSATFSASNLPPGLAMASSGAISGTPTTPGTFAVIVSANVAGFGVSRPAERGSAVVTIRILNSAPAVAAPLITSAANGVGAVGAPFEYATSATGFPTGFTASGLPAGLGIDATSGAITGTPSVAGIFGVTLGASNAGGATSVTLFLKFAATPAAPAITSDSTVFGTVGVAFPGYLIAASPNVTSHSATNLPPGLVSENAGQTINGTPTTAGVFLVTISASNSVGATSGILTIVIAAAPDAPEITSAIAAAGRIGAPFSYSISASNLPTSYAASSLPAGLSVNAVSGLINGTPTTVGVFNIPISASKAGSTGTATLTVTTAATVPRPVILNEAATAGTVGAAFSFYLSASNSPTSFTASNLPPGLSLDSFSQISGIPTSAGVFSVPFSVVNAGGAADATLTIAIAAYAPALPLPVITSSAAARGLAGAAFTHKITAANAPSSFGASNLPAGLTLNATTGVISGKPTAAGSANVNIAATNASGTTSAIFTLDVSAEPLEPPVISSGAGAFGQIGEPFFYAITASNLPTSFTATSLPAGLALDTATGLISGTPTASTNTTISVTASNALGAGSAVIGLTIGNSTTTPRISSSAAAAATVGTAFSYFITATPTAFSYSASGLPPGLLLTASTGRISGTPSTAGTYSVTVSASTSYGTASGVVRISVGATSPAAPIISSPAGVNAFTNFPFGYRITASNAPTSFSATGLPSGLALDPATGWITGTAAASGTFTVALAAGNASGTGTASLKIAIPGSAPTVIFTSSAAVAGLVGAPLSYKLSTSSTGSFYSLFGSLPSGLTLNLSTSEITGTPVSAGVAAVSVSANGGSAAYGTITFSISSVPLSPPVISSAASAIGYAGVDFSYALAAANLPTAFSASNLPPGLGLDASSGQISGKPASAGTFAVAVSATNARGQGTATVTLRIAAAPPPPMITNAAAASATVGVKSAILKIMATNSAGAFTATGLPGGVSLDPATGVISGQPLVVGVYPVQVTAANGTGVASATITLTIAPAAAPVFSGNAADSAFFGLPFSAYLSASGAAVSYVARGLPTGLALDPATGRLAGRPTVAGVFPIAVSATNAGGTANAIFTLTITAPPVTRIGSGDVTARGAVGSAFTYAFTLSTNPSGISVPAALTATGLPPGLGVDGSGRELIGTPTTAGSYLVTLSAANAGGVASARVFIVIAPRQAPVITSALGVAGTLGQSFSHPIAATQAATAFTASSLPPGLSVNAATGVISGTPTATGSFPVSVGAANEAGTGSAQILLRIGSPPTAPPTMTSAAGVKPTTIFPTTTTTPVVSYAITATGFPSSFTAINLPPGLVLNPWTGAITGAPLAAGVFQVPISATGGAGTATAVLTITVPASAPALGRTANVIGHVGRAFSTGVTPPSNSFIGPGALNFPTTFGAAGLPPGLSIDTVQGAISGTPTQAGTFFASLAASTIAGTSTAPLTFLIDNVPPTPQAPALVIGPVATPAILGVAFGEDYWFEGTPTDFEVSGLPPGLSFTTPNGTLNGVPTKFLRVSGTPSNAGEFTISLIARNAVGSASAAVKISVASTARTPIISSYAAASGRVGAAFNYYPHVASDDAASGSPVTFSASNLPAGLSMAQPSGQITGAPQVAGVFIVPITAMRAGIAGTALLTFKIEPASPVPPSLSLAAGALGFVGVPANFYITATNAPDELLASALPPGLSFAVSNGASSDPSAKLGTIGGVPTSPGTYAIPISASNAFGSTTAVLTLTIIAPDAVTSPESYDSWIASYFSAAEIAAGLADGAGDFNNDGTANLLDYALRRNPRTGSGGSLPVVFLPAGGDHLAIAFTRDPNRSDLSYVVEASDDLETWTALAASLHGVATSNLGGARSVSESGSSPRSVIVEDGPSMTGYPARFLRLKVTRP